MKVHDVLSIAQVNGKAEGALTGEDRLGQRVIGDHKLEESSMMFSLRSETRNEVAMESGHGSPTFHLEQGPKLLT